MGLDLGLHLLRSHGLTGNQICIPTCRYSTGQGVMTAETVAPEQGDPDSGRRHRVPQWDRLAQAASGLGPRGPGSNLGTPTSQGDPRLKRSAYMLEMNVRPASLARLVKTAGLMGAMAFATALIAAVVLAIVDIYITGHGGASLMRPWLSWHGAVELSRADALFLLAALCGAAGGLLLTRYG